MSSETDAPQITLHWLEKSRAQRILWLLEELNVPYDIKTYKRDPKTMFADPALQAIHPLGKAPVLTIGDYTIAESAVIVEYLGEHFQSSSTIIPPKWKPGLEGKLNGETEEYKRYRYFMHYAEGSLMPFILVSLVSNDIKKAPVPFFIKPITSQISAKIMKGYVSPNYDMIVAFLEEQLATAPNGGPFLCGDKLTGADIMMSFPILVATRATELIGMDITRATHPNCLRMRMPSRRARATRKQWKRSLLSRANTVWYNSITCAVQAPADYYQF
ncbi:unnamed protein product [Mycena citricolor]|uniref:glutathione transferase n=1 Tax=Mycena citricolor TaxID=2018698 RepID=A0AAD2HUJ4_9AGAR|nr:unnamed protein product [Mycena citricolor]